MKETCHNTTGRNLWCLVIAACVSSLGGFLFGYDNIVISGAIGYMTKAFHLDPAGVGWAAGCALVGCLAGSAGSGWLADRIGLKKSLAICAACFAGSSIGVFYSGTFTQFVIWRILGGIGIGAASILAPMYIAEIAPTRMRGRLVTLYQLGIVLGILCAVWVNMVIQRSGSEAWNLSMGWKWMFLAGAAPAVLFALTIVAALESPRWLMKVGRSGEGLGVLTQINGEAVAREESKTIAESLSAEEGKFSELFTTGFGKALLIGIALAGLSQTSGITPVFSYLPSIFEASGAKTSDAFFQSVLVSFINLVATLVALALVDKAGRRTLLLTGTCVQTVAFIGVGLLYWVGGHTVGILAGVMLFVLGHAVGNGAICWVIISEIFPTKVRGRAMSIAVTSLWVFAFLGNLVFPILQRSLGNHGVFWTFAFMALVNVFFVLFLVPETRGRSLEQIEEMWVKTPHTQEAATQKTGEAR
jgi:MFS transporter, SP family, arabinose:H+ symporter